MEQALRVMESRPLDRPESLMDGGAVLLRTGRNSQLGIKLIRKYLGSATVEQSPSLKALSPGPTPRAPGRPRRRRPTIQCRPKPGPRIPPRRRSPETRRTLTERSQDIREFMSGASWLRSRKAAQECSPWLKAMGRARQCIKPRRGERARASAKSAGCSESPTGCACPPRRISIRSPNHNPKPNGLFEPHKNKL